jgi:hypothetical protein
MAQKEIPPLNEVPLPGPVYLGSILDIVRKERLQAKVARGTRKRLKKKKGKKEVARRTRVLEIVRERGVEGLTLEELQVEMPDLPHRCTDLADLATYEDVVHAGKVPGKGKHGVVWRYVIPEFKEEARARLGWQPGDAEDVSTKSENDSILNEAEKKVRERGVLGLTFSGLRDQIRDLPRRSPVLEQLFEQGRVCRAGRIADKNRHGQTVYLYVAPEFEKEARLQWNREDDDTEEDAGIHQKFQVHMLAALGDVLPEDPRVQAVVYSNDPEAKQKALDDLREDSRSLELTASEIAERIFADIPDAVAAFHAKGFGLSQISRCVSVELGGVTRWKEYVARRQDPRQVGGRRVFLYSFGSGEPTGKQHTPRRNKPKK